MPTYYPLLIMGAIIGVVTTVFIIAYATMKDKKTAIGFDRHMKDGEIIRRILAYARPYAWNFVLVGVLMLLTVSYDILAPILVGEIESIIKVDNFELARLWSIVIIYGSILVVSLVSSYYQAMLLQRTGQKILSGIRESVFTHIESLSHSQLNHIPTGKLVTRVTNDTNAISMMFTHLLVNLVKNCFVIVGVLAAMLMLNYGLTLMILCFTPFIVTFTLIFRKFSRRAYRRVKDANTDINTYLSENLSGMKITQIFNRQERKAAEFEERNLALDKARRQEILVFSVFRPMVYTLYMTSILCLFYFGA
ncbi:MAG: ABC transporter ATP-binding protein, partial [Clostridia bacterium]|nr:ABC transporter ATP-binding protein [Clostridia bacterium]